MTVAWISVITVLSFLAQDSLAGKKSEQQILEQKVFDPIFREGKQRSDTKSLPFRRVTQLYSRNSREHIRILPNRKVDAMGKDGNKYAMLIIESDNFGRVRIRGAATNYYLCIDKRKRLRARVRGRRKDNCIFKEHFAKNAFTEFTSVKKNHLHIAFNRRGKQRACNKTRSGMKAVQFIERPLRLLRLYRGRKNRKNRRNGKLERDAINSGHTVCITVKSWNEWKSFLKWRRKKRQEKRRHMKRISKKYNLKNPTTAMDVAKRSRNSHTVLSTPPSKLTLAGKLSNYKKGNNNLHRQK